MPGGGRAPANRLRGGNALVYVCRVVPVVAPRAVHVQVPPHAIVRTTLGVLAERHPAFERNGRSGSGRVVFQYRRCRTTCSVRHFVEPANHRKGVFVHRCRRSVALLPIICRVRTVFVALYFVSRRALVISRLHCEVAIELHSCPNGHMGVKVKRGGTRCFEAQGVSHPVQRKRKSSD